LFLPENQLSLETKKLDKILTAPLTIEESEGIIKEKQGEEDEPKRQHTGERSIQGRKQTPPTYITYTPSVVDLEAPQKIEGRDEELAKYIASILKPITKYATENFLCCFLKR